MWQVIGVGILCLAAGIWIGANYEHWYLRNRYQFRERWYRYEGMEG
jgi:hypothetical protein